MRGRKDHILPQGYLRGFIHPYRMDLLALSGIMMSITGDGNSSARPLSAMKSTFMIPSAQRLSLKQPMRLLLR
jgi:hypothetical protein